MSTNWETMKSNIVKNAKLYFYFLDCERTQSAKRLYENEIANDILSYGKGISYHCLKICRDNSSSDNVVKLFDDLRKDVATNGNFGGDGMQIVLNVSSALLENLLNLTTSKAWETVIQVTEKGRRIISLDTFAQYESKAKSMSLEKYLYYVANETIRKNQSVKALMNGDFYFDGLMLNDDDDNLYKVKARDEFVLDSDICKVMHNEITTEDMFNIFVSQLKLTDRQTVILKMIVRGYSLGVIASKLSITKDAVKDARKAIQKKAINCDIALSINEHKKHEQTFDSMIAECFQNRQ